MMVGMKCRRPPPCLPRPHHPTDFHTHPESDPGFPPHLPQHQEVRLSTPPRRPLLLQQSFHFKLFLLAVLWFGESLADPSRILAFVLIWIAIAVYSIPLPFGGAKAAAT